MSLTSPRKGSKSGLSITGVLVRYFSWQDGHYITAHSSGISDSALTLSSGSLALRLSLHARLPRKLELIYSSSALN